LKALVTGAGGFIGSFLLRELGKRGYTIRALFLPEEDAIEALGLGVEITRGDITRRETLQGLTKGIDIVFHLATRVLDWGSMSLFRRVMVDGTRNLLEESRGAIKRFVYFSSLAALGLGRDVVGLNEDAERRRCGIPYCDTKIEAEDLVSGLCDEYRIPYTIIRPANVIGPGSVWVKDVLDAFYRGPLPLIDGGRAPGAFVYVTNLVEGAILAAESERAIGRTYHFRDDYDITWREYLETLGAWIGKKPLGNIPFKLAWFLGHLLEIILTPFGLRPPMTRLAAGVMGRNNDVDNSRARDELGWKSLVTLDDALLEIEKWVREIYIPDREKK
jgi:nucleoside-diphosphate-sugar epimerase